LAPNISKAKKEGVMNEEKWDPGPGFDRAMEWFLKCPEPFEQPENNRIKDLISGWGNQGYSALGDYIAAGIAQALVSKGPILECGSGLTTVLLGAIGKARGYAIWTLEHKSKWAKKTRQALDRYKIDSVTLCEAPLRDYGKFSWYDPPLSSMPDQFSLVICDGPPGRTKGGRSGLLPIMGNRFAPGCMILLDDAHRDQEMETAQRWGEKLNTSVEILGSTRSYIKLLVPDKIS